jgi:hypothetical protein
MTVSFNFDAHHAEDLQKFLALMKEHGFDKFVKKTTKNTTAMSRKRVWKHFGIGNLSDTLDNVNIRDFAYED